MNKTKHRRGMRCRYLKCTPVSFKPKKRKSKYNLTMLLRGYKKFQKSPGYAEYLEEIREWDQMVPVGAEIW